MADLANPVLSASDRAQQILSHRQGLPTHQAQQGCEE